MPIVVTRYLKGGGIRKIAEVGDAARYGVPSQRASRVEPLGLARRLLFLLLRRVFGDAGRMAAWTRRWRGPWRARMLLGDRPVLGPFPHREQALEAEAQWLVTHWVLAKEDTMKKSVDKHMSGDLITELRATKGYRMVVQINNCAHCLHLDFSDDNVSQRMSQCGVCRFDGTPASLGMTCNEQKDKNAPKIPRVFVPNSSDPQAEPQAPLGAQSGACGLTAEGDDHKTDGLEDLL